MLFGYYSKDVPGLPHQTTIGSRLVVTYTFGQYSIRCLRYLTSAFVVSLLLRNSKHSFIQEQEARLYSVYMFVLCGENMSRLSVRNLFTDENRLLRLSLVYTGERT